MAHNGYARSIRPVHTSSDGDTIYAVSIGNIKADIDVVGTLASRVISEAIISAVNKAESDYGYPSAKDLNNCDAYATYIINDSDLKALKGLLINVICEPRFYNE